MSTNYKTKDIIRLVKKNGYILKRHKGGHAIYYKGDDMIVIPISSTQNQYLFEKIIKSHELVV